MALGIVAIVATMVVLFGRAPKPLAAGARGKPEASAAHARPAGRDRGGDAPQPEGLWLEGQVMDLHGEPARGAAVSIDTTPPRTVATDSFGAFAFGELAPGEYRVVARATGAFAGPVPVRVVEGTEPLQLQLVRAAGLIVTALDEDSGSPIADAEVIVRGATTLRTNTDEAGVAAFQDVPPGPTRVSVLASDHAEASLMIPVAEGGGALELRIRAARGQLTQGEVVDDAGRAISGARVRVATPWGTGEAVARSDDDGRFSLRVGDGIQLVADAEGYPTVRTGVLGRSELAAGPRIVLLAGRTIAGVARQPDGTAVIGATIRVVDGASDRVLATSTAADGGFTVSGLPRERVTLGALDAGGRTGTVVVPAGDDVDDVVIELGASTWIRGRVLDAEGEVVANATVVATPTIAGRLARGSGHELDGAASTSSDESGAFELVGLAPGRYVVRARASDTTDDDLGVRRGLEVDTGSEDVSVVIDASGSLRGKLVDADGAPITRFQLRLDLGRPRDISTGDGVFELAGVPVGTHSLAIDAPEIAAIDLAEVAVTAGSPTELGTLHAERGIVVRGRVVDASGVAVAGAIIAIGDQVVTDARGVPMPLRPGGEAGFTVGRSDVRGAFEIAGIEPGSSTVLATHATLGRSRPLVVESGDAAIELVLGGNASVVGNVRGPDGPVAAVVELIAPEGPRARQLAEVAADGSFAFSGLAAGSYVVSARTVDRNDRSYAHTTEIEVAAGATAELTLPLAAGDARLTVALGGAQGLRQAIVVITAAPVDATDLAEMDVRVAASGGALATATSIGDGDVVFDRLDAGNRGVCVVRFAVDPEDPAAVRRVQLGAATLPVVCRAVDLVGGVDVRVDGF